MKRLLIAGCGDLGVRMAGRLDPGRWRITGLRRSRQPLPAPLETRVGDLVDGHGLDGIRGHWDAVVYQATPDAREEHAYRATLIEGPARLFSRVTAGRLIFVSSTAVYGQDDGEWVDERSATRPRAFNGRVLLEAEQRVGALAPESVVVRFSGIYGPGRERLIRSVQSGSARCRREPPQWTNRIHADDAAATLAHVLELDVPAPLYCATDSEPAPRCEVLEWLARQLGAPPPEPDDSTRGQGKRVGNARLLASGLRLHYPDYRTGYRGLVK